MVVDAVPSPEAKIVKLLETLPAEDRIELTTWLMRLTTRPSSISLSGAGLGHGVAELRRRLGTTLSNTEGYQLVTVRLPTEQHDRLRTWCADHNFAMAAVVRGLVERFLDEQAPATG